MSSTNITTLTFASFDLDLIEAYLASSVEPIATYGGTVQYWSSKLDSNPRLARMALDYLTTPGVYSCACLMV